MGKLYQYPRMAPMPKRNAWIFLRRVVGAIRGYEGAAKSTQEALARRYGVTASRIGDIERRGLLESGFDRHAFACSRQNKNWQEHAERLLRWSLYTGRLRTPWNP